MVCNSRSPRRAGERMRPTASRSSCFAPGAGLPLSGFQGSPAAPLAARSGARARSGRMACAATRRKWLLVSYRPLALQNRGRVIRIKSLPFINFSGLETAQTLPQPTAASTVQAVAATAKPLDQTGHSQHARCIATPCRNSARNAADAAARKARAKAQSQAIDCPRRDRRTITEVAAARQCRRRGHGRSFN